MVKTAGSRRGGIAAAAGGVLAPLGLSALVFVLLRASSSADPSGESVEISMIFASVFLGFVAFDLAVAIGMASSRAMGRGAGRYSSLVGLTVLFWFFWVATTGITAGDHPSWTANTSAALVVGVVCLAVEFLGVRQLDRIGTTNPAP
jgi:hypothetical protein